MSKDKGQGQNFALRSSNLTVSAHLDFPHMVTHTSVLQSSPVTVFNEILQKPECQGWGAGGEGRSKWIEEIASYGQWCFILLQLSFEILPRGVGLRPIYNQCNHFGWPQVILFQLGHRLADNTIKKKFKLQELALRHRTRSLDTPPVSPTFEILISGFKEVSVIACNGPGDISYPRTSSESIRWPLEPTRLR